MSDIQREQLEAFIEAHSRSATAMEKITGAMEAIARSQEKMWGTMEALSRVEANQKDLKDYCLKAVNELVPEVIDDKLKNCSIARDVEHTKWLIGIITIVIIICTCVLRATGGGDTNRLQGMQTQILQHIVEQEGNHGFATDKDTDAKNP